MESEILLINFIGIFLILAQPTLKKVGLDLDTLISLFLCLLVTRFKHIISKKSYISFSC